MTAYNGKVTVWIRKEDRAKFKAIKNKSEWLHEHLALSDYSVEHAKELTLSLSSTMVADPTITAPEDAA